MATLIAIPILGAAVLLQTTILSRITLLNGPADLVLLILVSWVLQERVTASWQWALIAGLLIGAVTALPGWVPLLGYLLVTALALVIRNRVWQIPVLALLVMVIAGTVLVHGVSFMVLSLEGNPIGLQQAFNLITLPSLLLNILLAIPVNSLVSEIARWTYPPEIEI